MNAPLFLSREEVLGIHHLSLQLHGGLDGLRDPGLLDSALTQPFIDGNKRTAMGSALTFLRLNGISPAIFDGVVLYDAMIAIAERRLDKTGLAAIFRRHLAS